MKILFANVGGLMFGYKDFVKELENEFPGIEFMVPKSGDEAPRLAVDADVCFGIPTIETFEAAQRLKWRTRPQRPWATGQRRDTHQHTWPSRYTNG